ncbi:hypothetical protein [Deinococcus sp.]|nr:hypothetical protein [Deinococcus sp.]
MRPRTPTPAPVKPTPQRPAVLAQAEKRELNLSMAPGAASNFGVL